jgi:hypothetical protein
VAAPVAALILAALAAVGFAVAEAIVLIDSADSLFTVIALLAGALIVWATIVEAIYAAWLVTRLTSRRRVFASEAALAAAGFALIAVVVTAHPLWGSGSGGS